MDKELIRTIFRSKKTRDYASWRHSETMYNYALCIMNYGLYLTLSGHRNTSAVGTSCSAVPSIPRRIVAWLAVPALARR